MRIQSEGRKLNMMFVTKRGKQEIRTFVAQENVLKNGKLASQWFVTTSQWFVTTWRGESLQKLKIVSTQTLNANDGILLFGSQGDAVVCEEDAVEIPERYSKYVRNVHRI